MVLVQAFGIASLVLSVVAIFVPVFGVFISGLSGILAWISTGRALFLGLAAVIINLCNIFLFSPTFLLLVGLEVSQRTAEQHKLYTIWSIVLFIQIAAIIIFVFNAILLSFLKRRRLARQADGEIHQTRPKTSEPEIRLSGNNESGNERNRNFWGAIIGSRDVRTNNQSRTKDFAMLGVGVLIFCLGSLAVYHSFIKDEPWVPYNRIYEKKNVVTERQEVDDHGSKGQQIGPLDRNSQITSEKSFRSPDRIYSYTKRDGSTGYTNTAPPSDGKAVKERPELAVNPVVMPVEIQDGKIYVPVSIEHRGNKFETSFLLDLNSANTILPQRNADFVKADRLTKPTYQIIQGRGTFYEIRALEHFQVGPKYVQGFRAMTLLGEGATQRGVLGQDFLGRFNYHIDEKRQVIVWNH